MDPPPLRWGMLGLSDFLRRVALPGLTAAANGRLICVAVREARGRGDLPELTDVDLMEGYEALLARDDVDAVYVTLPNALHEEWVLRALDAGKHVLCEKPMAVSAAAVETITARAAQRHRVVMEGYMYRFHPQWQAVAHLLDRHELGTVRTVVSQYSYRDDDFGGPRFSAELGGGTFRMVGCYGVSIARLAFRAEPRAVTAIQRLVPAADVDRTMSTLMEFGEGHAILTASVEVFDSQYIQILGDRASVMLEAPVNPASNIEPRVILSDADGSRLLPVGPADQFRVEFETFARVVSGECHLPIPLSESVANARVMESVLASARSGGARVDVPEA